jgi:hypothetical protein
MKVTRIQARLAFPNIFNMSTVQGSEGSKPSYSCTLLVEPGSDSDKRIQAALKEVAQAKWGEQWQTVFKTLKSQDRIAYRDGNTKLDRDGNVQQGFADMKAMSCRSYQKLMIIDRDGTTVLNEEDGRPYGGCYVSASIDIWAQQSSQWGRRLNCKILGLQFVKDGDAFAAGAPATIDDFDQLDDPDDTGFDLGRA